MPENIDAAYYLIHSMSSGTQHFDEAEATCAENFIRLLVTTKAQQIIYRSGISNAHKLSKHLTSRLQVEEILAKVKYQSAFYGQASLLVPAAPLLKSSVIWWKSSR